MPSPNDAHLVSRDLPAPEAVAAGAMVYVGDLGLLTFQYVMAAWAGTYFLQCSDDGVTWINTITQALGATTTTTQFDIEGAALVALGASGVRLLQLRTARYLRVNVTAFAGGTLNFTVLGHRR